MTPKMQLSEDCPVTPAFRAEMNAWMIEFFGYKEDTPRKFDDANIITKNAPATLVKAKPKKSVKARKTKTQIPVNNETLRGLLDSLAESFNTMRVPTISGSWLTRREESAIKKMGVFVPKHFVMDSPEIPIVQKNILKPAIASALFVPSKHETAGKLYPRFVYCIKQPKLPHNVEAMKGVAYKFGMLFQLNQTESGKPMPPKNFWSWCWMVVSDDGEINVPHEYRGFSSKIIHKRSHKRGNMETYHYNQWSVPSLAVSDDGRDIDTMKQMLKGTFRQLLIWWESRQHQWSVGIRKDGHRVTFSIAKEQTAAYFADRDTIVNVDGKPRKIVHFVREHTRSNGATVKAHIRGLSEFDWNGYHCSVTAPGLNGAIYTASPLSPAQEIDDSQEYIDTDEMAAMLAEAEDCRA